MIEMSVVRILGKRMQTVYFHKESGYTEIRFCKGMIGMCYCTTGSLGVREN